MKKPTGIRERNMPGNIREAEYGPGGAIILGALTLAIIIIVCPLAVIASSNGQGSTCSPDATGRPLLPCESSAKAIVTISSTHSLLSVHYLLYLNDELQAEGDLSPGSSIIKTVTLIFPTDQSGSYHAVIMGTSNWNGFLGNSDETVLTVECNHTYPITLNI